MNTNLTTSCADLGVIDLVHYGLNQVYELVLQPPGWERWRPGQFVMLRPAAWELSPLLPRPFSISSVDESGLHILFQAVGKGTRLMAGLGKGERVVVWGPLGTGFDLEGQGPVLLLAGGMGIAPMVGLVRDHHQDMEMELVFGHRLDLSCYPFHSLSRLIRAEAHQQESMEDIEKFVTYLREKMAGYVPAGRVLACGPNPFLKAVQATALALGLDTQLSLERRMACGVGACLGCVVEKKGEGLVQSCTRGPVFRAQDVVL